MGFLDGLASFFESLTNSMDKQAEKKLNDYNSGKGNVTDEQAMGYVNYSLRRMEQKSCTRCGGAVCSNTSDYCRKCRNELGLD